MGDAGTLQAFRQPATRVLDVQPETRDMAPPGFLVPADARRGDFSNRWRLGVLPDGIQPLRV